MGSTQGNHWAMRNGFTTGELQTKEHQSGISWSSNILHICQDTNIDILIHVPLT